MTPLRRRMTEDMQVRNFSPHTQNSYVQQVSLFARHFSKTPEVLGPEEIRSYQVYLTNEKKLAPSSILIAVSALRFLYKVTLHRDWCLEDIIPAPKRPQKLPIVLSPEEVLQFLSCVQSINPREAPQSWGRSPANKARRLAPHRGAVPTIADLSSCGKWQTLTPVAW
jgi:integrase/recombinase XerD